VTSGTAHTSVGAEPPDSPLELTVNGRPRRALVRSHHTLLEVLRTDLGLTGTKECCLVGECGACTVILDGRSVDACLVLALEAAGSDVVTIEGLAAADGLDALQQAFLDHGAAQCGFCIPGQLVAARALLQAIPEPSRAEVEDGLAGNLCRPSDRPVPPRFTPRSVPRLPRGHPQALTRLRFPTRGWLRNEGTGGRRSRQ